jgi:hypothetical protein
MNKQGAKYFISYTSKLDKRDSIITPVLLADQDGEKI